MPMTAKRLNGLLDFALVAGLVAFCATLINAGAMRGPLVTAALIAITLFVTAIGIWREASREEQMDEVELAGASFGARWGVCAVILLTLLTGFLVPLQDVINQIAIAFESATAGPVPPAVRLFMLGIVCALVLQLGTKSIITAIWHRMKS